MSSAKTVQQTTVTEKTPATQSLDWSMLICRGLGPVALALTLGVGLPAKADLSRAEPVFSVADSATIARNASLRGIVDRDPWLVHKILRTIESSGETREFKSPVRPSKPPPKMEKPSEDPDLEAFKRSSPEAANDLFQLIKQAGQGGTR